MISFSAAISACEKGGQWSGMGSFTPEADSVTTTEEEEEEEVTPTEVQEPSPAQRPTSSSADRFDRWFDHFYGKIKPVIKEAVRKQVRQCKAAGCREPRINFSSRACITCVECKPPVERLSLPSRSRSRSR